MGGRLRARPDSVAAALKGVLDDGRFPYCVQDASVVPLPSPLDEEAGIRSYYLLELHGLARGVLFVAHTDVAPRGFTLLCRRLGLSARRRRLGSARRRAYAGVGP